VDSLRGKLNNFRSCYDVYFYNLDIDININSKSIAGFVDIYFSVVNDFDTMQIDLYPNMSLDSIVFEKKNLHFNRVYGAVFVLFDKHLTTNEKAKIRVYYHGKPVIAKKPPWEGGFVWKKDKNKNPWIGVACEVAGASLWWPVKDHLSDKPDSMKLNFTVPAGLMCVSNGHMVDSVPLMNKTKYTWKLTYPVNSYNATMYIGKFSHFSMPYQGVDTSFNLDFYVIPQHLEKAKEHFLQVQSILHFYESAFGPYPWPKDGYKLVESPYEGMENQTAIAYGNNYNNFINAFDQIILHETAHEWWGNSINVPDYAEVWIHEGMAAYAEAMYTEHNYGHNFYLSYLKFYALLIRNKKTVVGPHDVNFWDYKDGDVYMKGALMLHTLRNTLTDDSLFFNIIKSFYNKYKYKEAVSQDFINLVNEMTGKDYSWFFKQYLYKRSSPELLVKKEFLSYKNTYELQYKWSNVDSDFSIPLKIVSGNETYTIWPTTKLQKIYLNKEKAISINTEESYIALKTVNNLE
jgi:aminopeptidase N